MNIISDLRDKNAHAKELFSEANSKLLKGIEDLESLRKEKEFLSSQLVGAKTVLADATKFLEDRIVHLERSADETGFKLSGRIEA